MKANNLLRNSFLYVSWICFLPLVIIGNIFYEERLEFLYVSVNTVLFLLTLIFIALSIYKDKKLKFLLDYQSVFLLFFIFMSPLVFFAAGSNYEGIIKYYNSIVIGFIGALILTYGIRTGNTRKLFSYLYIFLFVLFVCAIIWKLQTGFWRRDLPYFLNGSIVFGRNMAVGLFAVMLFPPRNAFAKYLLLLCFLFGVVWSMSKGPILSVFLCISFYFFLKNKVYFVIFSGLIVTFLFLITTSVIDLSGGPLNRLQIGLQVLLGFSDSNQAAGSVNIRQEMFSNTVDVIKNDYFTGVGAGLWGEALNSVFTYPHNFFLEVFSELGVIYGLVFIIPYLSFIFRIRDYFYVFPLFFLLAQQMSGDIADARWLLMFSLVVTFNSQLRRVNYHKI